MIKTHHFFNNGNKFFVIYVYVLSLCYLLYISIYIFCFVLFFFGQFLRKFVWFSITVNLIEVSSRSKVLEIQLACLY